MKEVEIIKDGYVNLSGLTGDLGFHYMFIHSDVWSQYLSLDIKVSLTRALEILNKLLDQLPCSFPFTFTVDFGGETVSLKADFRIRDKAILIDLDGGAK